MCSSFSTPYKFQADHILCTGGMFVQAPVGIIVVAMQLEPILSSPLWSRRATCLSPTIPCTRCHSVWWCNYTAPVVGRIRHVLLRSRDACGMNQKDLYAETLTVGELYLVSHAYCLSCMHMHIIMLALTLCKHLIGEEVKV